MLPRRPGRSNGRGVRILIDEPMPPDAIADRLLLYTSTPATPSDARLAKSNERDAGALPPPHRNTVGIWRPLTVTRLNTGPKPPTVTNDITPCHRPSDTHLVHGADDERPVSGNWRVS